MKRENYIKKYKNALNEYVDMSSYGVYEADDDNQKGQAPMGGDDDDENDAPMGGGNGPMGGGDDAPMGGGDSPMGGDNGPMGGGDDSMGGDNQGAPSDMGGEGQGKGVKGLNPQTPQEGQDGTQGEEGEEGGDMDIPEGEDDDEDVEEVDVDDLTDAQEDTEAKVNKLMKKFSAAAEKMLSSVNKLSDKIDATEVRMKDIEKEIARRNPTPVEKLSMRSQDSYPFRVYPSQYWDKKSRTSNYSPEDDNDGVDEPQYQITKNDVDSMNDYTDISRELEGKRSLKDIFGY